MKPHHRKFWHNIATYATQLEQLAKDWDYISLKEQNHRVQKRMQTLAEHQWEKEKEEVREAIRKSWIKRKQQ